MNSRTFNDGLIILGAGLLASSALSFLERFAILGTATDFARGFLEGLAVVAFCVAIVVLVRSKRHYVNHRQ
jgi:hypothetical protein